MSRPSHVHAVPTADPQSTVQQSVAMFESCIYRACDALRRSSDGWNFDDIGRTNFDYVDRQLLHCLDAVSQARVQIISLIACCEAQVQLAEDAEYNGAHHAPLFQEPIAGVSKGGAS